MCSTKLHVIYPQVVSNEATSLVGQRELPEEQNTHETDKAPDAAAKHALPCAISHVHDSKDSSHDDYSGGGPVKKCGDLVVAHVANDNREEAE